MSKAVLPDDVAQYARTGDATALEWLQSEGMNTDLRDERGDTLPMLAGYHGRAEVMKMLLDTGAARDLASGERR